MPQEGLSTHGVSSPLSCGGYGCLFEFSVMSFQSQRAVVVMAVVFEFGGSALPAVRRAFVFRVWMIDSNVKNI